MAMNDTPEPLERATRAIREEEPAGWVDLSQSIIGRVRTLVAPAAAIVTFADDGRSERGGRGSTLQVSGRVLTPRLRAAVDSAARAADSIDITVTDDRCAAIRLGLVCSFGSDLRAEGDAARAAVADVLREVLGDDPAFDAERDIQIEIVDVVDGDPHRH